MFGGMAMEKKADTLFGIWDKIAFAVLCTLTAYCVLFGTATFFTIKGFTLWFVLIVALFVFALPSLFCRRKEVCFNIFTAVLVLLAGYMAIIFIRTMQNGHSVGSVVSAVGGLLYFTIFPFVLSVLSMKKRVEVLSKTVMYAGFAMSVMTVLFFISFLFFRKSFNGVLDIFIKQDYLNFTYISSKLCRILFVTTPLQLFSCTASVYFQVKNKTFSWLYMVITATGLFAMFITYTRALYLAALVSALVLVLFLWIKADKEQHKKLINHILTAVALCALLISLFSIAAGYNYFGFAINRTVGSGSTTPGVPSPPSGDHLQDQEDKYLFDTEVSDSYRKQIAKELYEVISQNPMFGAGFMYRLKTIQRMPEYTFLHLWAQMGLLGLALFFLPLVLGTVLLMRLVRKRRCGMSCLWVASLIGMMVYSIFQPYMQAASCIVLYSCALAVVNYEWKNVVQSEGV